MVGVNRQCFTHIGIGHLLRAQHGCCFYCGRKMKHATRDHLVPRKDGRTLALNMVLACPQCNHRKGCRPPTMKEVNRARGLYRRCGAPMWAVG